MLRYQNQRLLHPLTLVLLLGLTACTSPPAATTPTILPPTPTTTEGAAILFIAQHPDGHFYLYNLLSAPGGF